MRRRDMLFVCRGNNRACRSSTDSDNGSAALRQVLYKIPRLLAAVDRARSTYDALARSVTARAPLQGHCAPFQPAMATAALETPAALASYLAFALEKAEPGFGGRH